MLSLPSRIIRRNYFDSQTIFRQRCGKFGFAGILSADYSAADNAAVLIIEYGRLSGRHSLYGLIKNDLNLAAAQIFNGRGALGLMVSGLCKTADLIAFRRLGNTLEINVTATESIDQKIIFGAEDNRVILRADLYDKGGNAECDPQSFSLADSILVNTLVLT